MNSTAFKLFAVLNIVISFSVRAQIKENILVSDLDRVRVAELSEEKSKTWTGGGSSKESFLLGGATATGVAVAGANAIKESRALQALQQFDIVHNLEKAIELKRVNEVAIAAIVRRDIANTIKDRAAYLRSVDELDALTAKTGIKGLDEIGNKELFKEFNRLTAEVGPDLFYLEDDQLLTRLGHERLKLADALSTLKNENLHDRAYRRKKMQVNHDVEAKKGLAAVKLSNLDRDELDLERFRAKLFKVGGAAGALILGGVGLGSAWAADNSREKNQTKYLDEQKALELSSETPAH